MKNKRLELTELNSHPFSATFARSPYHIQIRNALSLLEAQLISDNQNSILLLLPKELLNEVSLITIERLLRHTRCQRVLLLVLPKLQTLLLETWKHAISWEDGQKLASLFSMTSQPQEIYDAQVCMTTVFDLQIHIGVDSRQPFFKAFEVIVLSDVPANPGPVWCQIVEIFARMGTRVIGLSALMPEQEGTLLFDRVITTEGTQTVP